MCKIIVPALAALSLASASTPASAEPVSVEVEYTDLNLSDPAGLAALDRRIERAISRVCGDRPRQLSEVRLQQRCAAAARASANEQVARVTRNSTSVALNR